MSDEFELERRKDTFLQQWGAERPDMDFKDWLVLKLAAAEDTIRVIDWPTYQLKLAAIDAAKPEVARQVAKCIHGAPISPLVTCLVCEELAEDGARGGKA